MATPAILGPTTSVMIIFGPAKTKEKLLASLLAEGRAAAKVYIGDCLSDVHGHITPHNPDSIVRRCTLLFAHWLPASRSGPSVKGAEQQWGTRLWALVAPGLMRIRYKKNGLPSQRDLLVNTDNSDALLVAVWENRPVREALQYGQAVEWAFEEESKR